MSEDKKVLFVHHGEVPGGAPTSLKNTVNALSGRKGYDITILCLNEAMKEYFREECRGRVSVGDLPDPCKAFGKVMIGWANIFSLATFFRFLRDLLWLPVSIYRQAGLFAELDPALVHLNSSILFTSALAARIKGIPLVWHVREVLHGSKMNPRKRLAGRLIRKLPGKVIAIGPAEKESVGGRGDDIVEVVHNFVPGSFRGKGKGAGQGSGEPAGTFVLLSLGGLSWRKGGLLLLQAARTLPPGIRVVILGCDFRPESVGGRGRLLPELQNGLENLLVKAGIKKVHTWNYYYRLGRELSRVSPNVSLKGTVKDVRPFIEQCDLLLALNTFPHSSRPLFESWMLKKPVLGFHIAGIAEYIEHGKDGLVIERMAAASLSGAIVEALRDRDALRDMGERGYEKARELFDEQRNVSRIIGIYERLMSPPPPSAMRR